MISNENQVICEKNDARKLTDERITPFFLNVEDVDDELNIKYKNDEIMTIRKKFLNEKNNENIKKFSWIQVFKSFLFRYTESAEE